MKQFKGLVLKEWYTNKKSILIPLWIIIGIYALMLISITVGLFKGGVVNVGFNIHELDLDKLNFILYTINIAMTIVVFFLIMITSISVSDNILNEEFKKKCSIFHLAQPIQLWKILLAKYSTVILSGFLLSLIISFINSTVFSIIYTVITKANFFYAYLALIQGIVLFGSTFIFVVSTAWVLDSICKEKGVVYGLLSFGALDLVILIINSIYKIHIPSLIQNFLKLAFGNTNVGLQVNSGNIKSMINHISYSDKLILMIQEVWINCLNTTVIYRILFSGILLLISYYFYKKRDIL